MDEDKSSKWDEPSGPLSEAFEGIVGKSEKGPPVTQPKVQVIPPDHPSTIEWDTRLSAHYCTLESIDFQHLMDPIEWLYKLHELMHTTGESELTQSLSTDIIKTFEEKGFNLGGLQIDSNSRQEVFKKQLIGLGLHELFHFNALQKTGFLKFVEIYKNKFEVLT